MWFCCELQVGESFISNLVWTTTHLNIKINLLVYFTITIPPKRKKTILLWLDVLSRKSKADQALPWSARTSCYNPPPWSAAVSEGGLVCSLENPEGCSRSDAPPGEQEDTRRVVYFTQTVHNKIISGLFRGSDKPYVVQLRNKNEPSVIQHGCKSQCWRKSNGNWRWWWPFEKHIQY